MRVLLTGATGFVGRALADALVAGGHDVVCTTHRIKPRQDSRFKYIHANFTHDFDVSVWLPRLKDIDIVINAVGIIREIGNQTFENIHVRAPCALFSACVIANVKLIIQISALGADEAAQSKYHLSKKKADDFLGTLPIRSIVAQPSLVFGENGESAKLFTTLAALPIIALPGGGRQLIQPVHIDDVVDTIIKSMGHSFESGSRIAIVGRHAISFRSFLTSLRTGMGLKQAYYISIPLSIMRIFAIIGGVFSKGLLNRETLQMLERGNIADPTPMQNIIERPPIAIEEFIKPSEQGYLKLQAQLNWLLPLLRISIAIVWIVTAIVSFGFYPVENSYELLANVGISGMFAPIALYGAATMDLIFGVATLALRKRRWLWYSQIAVIIGYSIIITWKLPEFWLHPYGPLLKNIPMLAAIWLLLELEER